MCSYTFPNGSTQNNITASTTYSSNLTTVLGCDSVIVTTVTVNDVFLISESVSICTGSDYTFPDGSIAYNVINATTHISNLQTANGCDSLIETTVRPESISNTIIVNGNEITTSQGGGATYQWLDCNNGNAAIQGENDATFIANSNGDYAVEITLNGCVEVSNCISVYLTGIEQFSKDLIEIYPNPTTQCLNVKTSEYIAQGLIYNGTGELVQMVNENQNLIDVSALPSGFYILVLETNDGLRRGQFIKE